MKFNPVAGAAALLGGKRRQRYEQIRNSDDVSDEESRRPQEEAERERDDNRALIHSSLWAGQIRDHKRVTIVVILIVLAMIGGWLGSLIYRNSPDQQCDTVRHGYRCKPELSQYWGQYSPYFSVPSRISPSVPEGCHLTFTQVLSRHGARDPTSGKTLRYKDLINRIHDQTTSYTKQFSFLKDFKYELGSDQLSSFGQQEMINAGSQFYDRYAALTKDVTPFIRASGQQRVIESAQNWTQGLHLSRMDDETSTIPERYPYDILIVPESPDFNNTLDFTLCTNFLNGDYGIAAQTAFAKTFIPSITSRLNQNLKGANLTDIDTVFLMDLCPFSTVAHPTGQITPFCNLFSEDEWQDYDYYQTVGKHYGFSWPNPLGPTQGVGFVNELIARVTGKAVEDHTSTNRTMDSSNATFPIYEGGKGVYADFSHDNDMMTIFAALGLFNRTQLHLPTTHRLSRSDPELAGYSAAYSVPFAARMFVEKMECREMPEKELVRIIVNDRVIPLIGCGADDFGRCEMGKWVESLEFARSGGKWDKCFGDEKGKVADGSGGLIQADGTDHAEDVKQEAKAKHNGKIEGPL